ncbi:MAG: 4-hydroxybenzoate octaprenyltransferase [Alphaproteobacteria bacterium]|nr:4-hydroxybenzoate octaprenyltransferase [Alphaproteobacteria bacterium]MBF0249574.1 4-hydroxybenzoate octaprenyltransferase [Alphaproteobacteria bacterium]
MTETVNAAKPAGKTESDRQDQSWIARATPGPLRPYMFLMRLDRPWGSWLLLLPCWWSVSLASGGGWPDLGLMALFALGAVIMRGAGCVMNDIADRDFDGQVARTANRPIPSGQVTVRQALAFQIFLGFVGLAILVQFNLFAIGVGILSLTTVLVYPYMKRFTYWPQIFLGLSFNWGALLGWAAVKGSMDPAAVVLYVAGIFWTLGYDTIYAHMDKDDDALVGIKSTALKLGDATPKWLVFFYAMVIALAAVAGELAGLSIWYYAALAPAALHLGWQIRGLDIHDPKQCLSRFKSNRDFGLLLLAAILVGQLVR